MGQDSIRSSELPAAMIAELAGVLARYGFTPPAPSVLSGWTATLLGVRIWQDGRVPVTGAEALDMLAGDPVVWVAAVRKGIAYHRFFAGGTVGTVCARSMRTGQRLPLSTLLDRVGHAEQCPACWTVEAAEPRCPEEDCGEPLRLIESGRVGHCGAGCGGDPVLAVGDDVEELRLSPAERMASVAAAAPEFVRRAPADEINESMLAAGFDAGPDLRGLAEVKDRRADRWEQVAGVIAAGLAPPPGEVRISDDGWSLTLAVESEAQVRAWAAALDVGDIAVRVFSPGKGAVVREIAASRSHPHAVRIACVQTLPDVPPRAAKVAAAAFADAGVTG